MWILFIFTQLLCANIWAVKAEEKIQSTKTKEEQSSLSPWQALEELKKGNSRFVSNRMLRRDLPAQVSTSKKQFPFAVVLNCMDSRGAPELIFDQGIGDIFVERLAGNVANADVLGGMEFGTKLMGAKLIVVLGHTSCGAIKGACDNTKLGNLTELLNKIRPAVLAVQKLGKGKNCEENGIDEMAAQNVRNVISQIKKDSPVIMELIKAGKIGLVGGMHDLATGKVSFFEDSGSLPGKSKT
jgi:carbonic anhydrase